MRDIDEEVLLEAINICKSIIQHNDNFYKDYEDHNHHGSPLYVSTFEFRDYLDVQKNMQLLRIANALEKIAGTKNEQR